MLSGVIPVHHLATLTVMILLAAIGNVARFPHAQKLVGYAGLGAAVRDSADTHCGGRITKQGRRDLRAATVEAAWVAVLHSTHWKARFEYLCRHRSKEKAIVAIARQMLVAAWLHGMTGKRISMPMPRH